MIIFIASPTTAVIPVSGYYPIAPKVEPLDMTRFLFLLLLLNHISFGQAIIIRGIITISTDSIYGDSVNNSPNIAFNDKTNLEQTDRSTAKVDIRLYKLFSLTNTKSVRRLFLIDTIWGAVEFEEWNKPKKIKKYFLTAKPNFDSLFLRLLSFNILTLPNQSDLTGKMQRDIQATADGNTTERKIHVMDRNRYTIEIKIGSKYRIYQFDNPDSYSKYYENIAEFKDYLSIVQTFDNLLNRK